MPALNVLEDDVAFVMPELKHAGEAGGAYKVPQDRAAGPPIIMPTDARMFASTLRSRRARQKGTSLALRWQPRVRLPCKDQEYIVGACVDAGHLWKAVPRRTVRQSRRKNPEHEARKFDYDLLRAACAQAAGWPAEMRLMVSLSDAMAPDEAFNARLNDILEETGFSVSYLDLVFPEAGLRQDDTTTCFILSALRDRGAQIYLSNFGSASSSLTVLKERALGGLLDGVQFDGMVLYPSGMTWPVNDIAAASTGMAWSFYQAVLATVKTLGLEVCVSGVETKEQLDFAVRAGCSEASGGFLAAAETTPQIAARFQKKETTGKKRRLIRTAEGF